MSTHLSRLVALVGIAAAVLAPHAGQAQIAPQTPIPPVTTVWQKLGVSQGLRRLRDGSVNRRGNFPGMERKPPLKAIADPANLESENPAIKAAAQVKQEEDLAKQKIKALKYLATVGCGCYDQKGEIEAAFLDALKDCTPAVRMAAIDAIMYLVESCDPQSQMGYQPTFKDWRQEHCPCDDVADKMRMMGVGDKVKDLIAKEREKQAQMSGCKVCREKGPPCGCGCCGHCCTFKIQERLAEMAYGEKNGCYIEPIADIRTAARRALCACPAPLCPDDEEKKGDEPVKGGKAPVKKRKAEGSDEREAEGQDDASAEDEEADESTADDSADEEDPETIPTPPGDQTTEWNSELKLSAPQHATNHQLPIPPLPNPSRSATRGRTSRVSTASRVDSDLLEEQWVEATDASVVPMNYLAVDFQRTVVEESKPIASVNDMLNGVIEVIAVAKGLVLISTHSDLALAENAKVVLAAQVGKRTVRVAAQVEGVEPSRVLVHFDDFSEISQLRTGAQVTLRVVR